MNAVFRENAQGHLGWRSLHFARRWDEEFVSQKEKPTIAFKHEGIQIIQQTVSLLLHLDSTSPLGQFVRDFFFFYFETSNEES